MLAKSIVDIATGEGEETVEPVTDKNHAAIALGKVRRFNRW